MNKYLNHLQKYQSLRLMCLALSALLTSCSLLNSDNAPTAEANQQLSAHKLVIVNTTDNVVSSIQYKPCGSQARHYKQLAGNLRPNERLTINLYSQCVDFLATNAFKKKLAQRENVNLNKVKAWNIQ